MNLKGIAFWVMLSIVVALSIYAFWWIKSESYQCVSNTPVFLIENLEKANRAPVSCICRVHDEDGAQALLTNEGFSKLDLGLDRDEDDRLYYNFSTIEKGKN